MIKYGAARFLVFIYRGTVRVPVTVEPELTTVAVMSRVWSPKLLVEVVYTVRVKGAVLKL